MPGRAASAFTSRNSVTVSWMSWPCQMHWCLVSSSIRSPRTITPPGAAPEPSARLGLVAAQQGADALDQQALAERLGDVVVGAEAQAHQLVHLLVLGGEEDHRHRAALAQPLQQLHAVHARHLDVEHRQVDRPGVQALQRAFAVGIGADLEALLLQRHRHAGEDVAVVVDQGDGLLHALFGRPPWLPRPA